MPTIVLHRQSRHGPIGPFTCRARWVGTTSLRAACLGLPPPTLSLRPTTSPLLLPPHRSSCSPAPVTCGDAVSSWRRTYSCHTAALLEVVEEEGAAIGVEPMRRELKEATRRRVEVEDWRERGDETRHVKVCCSPWIGWANMLSGNGDFGRLLCGP